MSPAPQTRIDAEQLDLMLLALRLPAIRALWKNFAERADTEGWPASRLLAALAEHELAERDRRRKERHLGEARLPPGKSLDRFEFAAVPTLSKARILALAAGDGWLEQGVNLLCLGPPGTGKTHLAAAIGFKLVENGYRVLFARTTDLVQKLQRARQEPTLEAALARLDRYHLLILDDFTYLQKNEAESGVLFELISLRYERRSILLTANQPFQEWARLFPSETVAVAAVDRLVHHSVILEMNAESYRRRTAQQKAAKPGRPAQYATRKVTAHPILASRLFADCPASPDRQDTHAALPCAASGRPERRVTEALTS